LSLKNRLLIFLFNFVLNWIIRYDFRILLISINRFDKLSKISLGACELYARFTQFNWDCITRMSVVADYPWIIRVPLTFFGEGCNTVTGTWRRVGMDGGDWVCSFAGNRGNFDSRFEGNSSRCCIEWFCLVFLDAILSTNKSAFIMIQ